MKSNVSILIVEDDRITADGLKDSLHSLGYERIDWIQNTSNFPAESFDLYLLDIGLSGSPEDGITLAENISSRQNGSRIIFISSYSDRTTLQRTEKVVHSSFLVKPVSDRQLYVAIEQSLSSAPRKKASASNCIYLKGKNKFYVRVLYNDIIFLKGENLGTSIKTVDNSIFSYNIISKIHKQIDRPDLIRVHRSYVVNLNRVSQVSENEIIMDSSNIIPIGRTYKQFVENHFTKVNPKP